MSGVNLYGVRFTAPTEKGIVSGALTPTNSKHTVAAETSTTDDLATINVSGFAYLVDGATTFDPILVLRAKATHTITVKHGTGNIELNSEADYDLTGNTQLVLLYDSATTKWSDILATGSSASFSVSTIDHGQLLGLTDDDHTQYPLKAGRSGGTTIYGGTASNNNIYIYPTSNTGGAVYLGSPAAHLAVNSTGDTWWSADGSGLPFGSCYGNEIGWSQANAVQNTWYNISDSDMEDGNAGLNMITHDGSGKLTVTKTGRYQVHYSVTLEVSAASDHIQSGIELRGSGTVINDGQTHFEATADKEETLSSGGIVYLVVGDTLEISVRTTDNNTPTLSVSHLNITMTMVGG